MTRPSNLRGNFDHGTCGGHPDAALPGALLAESKLPALHIAGIHAGSLCDQLTKSHEMKSLGEIN